MEARNGECEVVSGMSFDEFLKKRIFEPLGMNDTGFYIPEDKASRLVKFYTGSSKKANMKAKVKPGKPAKSKLSSRPIRLSGGVGLLSTAMDYLRFSRMLLNNGELEGTRILGRKAVELMRTDHMAGIKGPTSKLGYQQAFGLTMGINLSPGLTSGTWFKGSIQVGRLDRNAFLGRS